MRRWWRDDPNKEPWTACETFGANVTSPPVMIRSQFGATDETVSGNYELCVAVNGQIEHWWTTANPEPGKSATWARSDTFGNTGGGNDYKAKQVLGPIQSSFGFDLELVAELVGGHLQHFWRDWAGWHAGPIFS
jgi:hypothetical protein